MRWSVAAIGAAIAGAALCGGLALAKPPSHRAQNAEEMQSRAGAAIDAENHPGKALFEANCIGCHNGTVPKAPAIVWLQMMAPDSVLAAMRTGVMQRQASGLSDPQKVQVAEYLSRVSLADYKPPAPPRQCAGATAQFTGAPPANVGWGHDTRRFVPADVGGLTAKDMGRLKLKWAFAYPGAVRARSQPTLGWNTVFVGSANGMVYAFDINTGCTKWTYRASAEVRNAIVADPASKRLYFGDVIGRVYALDAFTGKELWRTKVEDHPNATITGTPALGGDSLFVPISSLEVTSTIDTKYPCCTFRGAVAALDPATGAIRWKTYVIPNPPSPQGKTSVGTDILGPSGAPVWTSPAYDAKRNRIYVGTGENYSSPADENSDSVIAFDATTGARVWHIQFTKGDAWNAACMIPNANCPVEDGPDVDLSASPLLIPLAGGKDMIVVGQKSGVTYGIDPDAGKIVWTQRLGHGGTQGGVHFGMSAEGTTVYVPVNDMPDTHDGRQYDAAINGSGVHAIDAATGKILWRHKAPNLCGDMMFCDSGASSASTAIPGAVLAGHLDGWFRAYDGRTGRILWQYDTKKPVMTVTGVKTTGGAMSGPGPAVYNGRLVFNSGYGMYFHMPGNVLYVFGK